MMLRTRRKITFSITAMLVCCACGGGGGEETGGAGDAPGDAVDAPGLPACPDEVDLTTVDLPCDCYGHVATDPGAQVPGCQSRVVCCPSIRDLRCEDHEKDVAAPDQAAEASVPDASDEPGPDVVADAEGETGPETALDVAADAPPEPAELPADVTWPNCPYEVDLATVETPCMCKGTLVTNPKHVLPDCTKKVVCCPVKGVICE